MKPSVAIYAIAKNEAARIGRMLESVKDADEIIILDTGSEDTTVDTARDFGATVHQAWIRPWRYDDARNAAMSFISPTIDLCQRIDCDEVMCPEWREKIKGVYTRDVNRYSYPQVNHSSRWGRNMRNDLHERWGFRWRYPTHEALEGPGGLEPTIPDYWVDHYPDTAKRRDNIETLRAEAARYPHDTRSAFYYARELYYSGLWVPARAEMERFIAMGHAWKTEVGEAYRMLGHMDAIPERWYWRAISEDPRRREPYCDLARHYHTKNRLDEARAMVKLADARTNENLYVTDTACWGDEWEEFKKQLEGSQP